MPKERDYALLIADRTAQTLMNRLHKKCLLASVGAHSLLLLILLVGPAFLSSKSKSDDLPVIDFIPSKFIDAPFAGGGNRNAIRSIKATRVHPAARR